MCWDSMSSGMRYQVQGHVEAPDPGVCDVSSAQVIGVHTINNCVVLGKYCGGSPVTARAVGFLNGALSSSG